MKKTLYKLDSKSKIRIWQIEAVGAILRQYSGLDGGKLVIHEKPCKIKNAGRANATTPEEQALKELESEYKAKLDEGYFLTQEEAKTTPVILPMLAESYEDFKDKIDWETAYVQPKLDGMRGLGNIDKIISRKNKILKNINHITKDLPKDIIIDGEIYLHGLSFQNIMKLIKKYRPNETENIMYYLYDLVSDKPFIERYQELKAIVAKSYNFELVPTYNVNSEAGLIQFHDKFVEEGYEGAILRWGNDGYQLHKRTSKLLKYKVFIDEVRKIHDIIPCEQRPDWGEPVFKCKGATGHRYGEGFMGAGMKYTHEERVDFLVNKKKYINKPGELRFFGYTDKGVPRHPVMYGIRLDK